MTTKITNIPKVTDPQVKSVRAAMEHRAIWFALIAQEAKKAGVPWETVEATLRSAISRCGVFHGNEMLEDSNGDMLKFGQSFLDEKDLFEMEVLSNTEEEFKIKFHYCPLVAGWQALGCDDEEIVKLCDIAMDGDRNIASTCGFDFTLGETIAEGHPCCEITFKKK